MLIVGCSFSFKRNFKNDEEYWAAMQECADSGCRRCQNGVERARHKMSCPKAKYSGDYKCICGAEQKPR